MRPGSCSAAAVCWRAFPKAYAIIMPAFYLPMIGMLLALVLRGVSFEFRWVAKPDHWHWDIAFTAGSTIAAFPAGRHPRRPDPGRERRATANMPAAPSTG